MAQKEYLFSTTTTFLNLSTTRINPLLYVFQFSYSFSAKPNEQFVGEVPLFLGNRSWSTACPRAPKLVSDSARGVDYLSPLIQPSIPNSLTVMVTDSD
jgi:hypothetical protein